MTPNYLSGVIPPPCLSAVHHRASLSPATLISFPFPLKTAPPNDNAISENDKAIDLFFYDFQLDILKCEAKNTPKLNLFSNE